MKSSTSVLKRTISVFNLILAICGAICLVGFIGCTIYQVLARNLLPKAPIWTEEAARFLFIYMVSFGVGLAVHTGDYVGVELLVDLLPEKGLRILKVITMFALAAFCFWYFFASVLDFAIFDYRYLSTAMKLPMQYIYISMMILFPALGISYILAAFVQISTPAETEMEHFLEEVERED